MNKSICLTDIIAPSFYSVHNSVKKHEYTHYMIDGGRGSTKSSFISVEIIQLIIKNPNVNAVVLRKVASTLRSSVYEQILWAIDKLGLNSYFKTTVSPLEIHYIKTGQKICFRGLDDKSKLKSIKIHQGYFGIVWYEELDEFYGMEEIRSVNQSLMRGGTDFWVFYSFNPPQSRDNWTNVEKLESYPNRLNHHSTYLDVPKEWLGEVFIEEAEQLKLTKPLSYEHEYLGVATGTGGTVFENVTERQISDDEIKMFNKFYYGIDFGFAVDPFVFIKLAFDTKRKILYIIDEIYEHKLKNSTAAQKIKNKRNQALIIYADCAEPKSIAELNDFGLKVFGAPKGADSVEHGVKWLQDLNEIVVDKTRTPNTYKELILYEYEKTKEGMFISSYPDKNNHSIDAIRYALWNVISSNALKITKYKGF